VNRLLLRIVRADVVRLVAVVAAVASLTLALAMIYPVQRELDTAAFSRATFTTFSEVELGADDVARVQADLGAQDTYLASEWEAPVGASGATASVTVMVTATPDATDVGWFSPDTQVAAADVGDTERWVDITSDLARRLGVRPGDPVQVGIAPDVTLEHVVRSVHAVRMGWDGSAAQVPAAPVFAATPGDAVDRMTILLARGDPQRVRDVLGDPFYQDRLRAGGYLDETGSTVQAQVAVPREHLAQQAADDSRASIALIVVVSLLAALGGVVFVTREVVVYLQACAPTARLLDRIGCSARRTVPRLASVGVAAVVVAVLAGGLIARLPYGLGLLAPALPATVTTLWWVALLVPLAAGLVATALTARSTRRGIERVP
jgi:hypothetical protein